MSSLFLRSLGSYKESSCRNSDAKNLLWLHLYLTDISLLVLNKWHSKHCQTDVFGSFFPLCVSFSELPHSPRSLTARLNDSDSRSVLLSWLRPFDGNSPLLHYLLELSENSMWVDGCVCVCVCAWAYFIVPE